MLQGAQLADAAAVEDVPPARCVSEADHRQAGRRRVHSSRPRRPPGGRRKGGNHAVKGHAGSLAGGGEGVGGKADRGAWRRSVARDVGELVPLANTDF